MRLAVVGLASLLIAAACGGPADLPEQRSALVDADIVSGVTFLQPETQALQTDEFSNPGYLWVDQGRDLFHAGETPCSSCHEVDGAGLIGAAAKYPSLDEGTGDLYNVEARINSCRERHQDQLALEYESRDLLSLTAFVSSLSKGVPHTPDPLSAATQTYYDTGEAYFFTRRGQFNISCAGCHNETWGKKLRGDTISQGHPNGFPAYRLEWQALGSLHRRLRDCDTGVRAAPLKFGDPTYTAVEYYLALRSKGLALESPAIRR